MVAEKKLTRTGNEACLRNVMVEEAVTARKQAYKEHGPDEQEKRGRRLLKEHGSRSKGIIGNSTTKATTHLIVEY